MAIKITLIGLHQIGASIGMALSAHKDKLDRTGIDPEPIQAQKWSKANVYDHLAYNLQGSVEDADAVIIALPADQVISTIKEIAGNLKPGAVVVDTSPLRQKAIQLAGEVIPSDRHFISATPVINPAYLDEKKENLDDPHADLFQRGAMIITSALDAHPDAIKLAADLCRLIGAHAYFSDPREADSITTSIDLLPKLAAAALVSTVTHQSGWTDSQRLANQAFLKTTYAVDLFDEEKALGLTAISNREDILRSIDELIDNLTELRSAVEAEDQETLQSLLEDARSRRSEWLDHRNKANWDDYPERTMPTVRETLGGLIGIRPRKKEPKK